VAVARFGREFVEPNWDWFPVRGDDGGGLAVSLDDQFVKSLVSVVSSGLGSVQDEEVDAGEPADLGVQGVVQPGGAEPGEQLRPEWSRHYLNRHRSYPRIGEAQIPDICTLRRRWCTDRPDQHEKRCPRQCDPRPDGHVQTVNNRFSTHVIGRPPVQRPLGMLVPDRAQVDITLTTSQVRDVRRPDGIEPALIERRLTRSGGVIADRSGIVVHTLKLNDRGTDPGDATAETCTLPPNPCESKRSSGAGPPGVEWRQNQQVIVFVDPSTRRDALHETCRFVWFHGAIPELRLRTLGSACRP